MSAHAEPVSPSNVLRVLVVGFADTGPDDAAASAAGLAVSRADDLTQARTRLAGEGFDAVVWNAPGVLPADLDWLQEWPYHDAAVVVAAPGDDLEREIEWTRAGCEAVLGPGAFTGPRWTAVVRCAVERKRLEVRSRRDYSTDPMTGLVNRQQLVEHLSHLLAVRAREPAPLGVVVLHVGDVATSEAMPAADALRAVRRKIAVRLRAGVRASDVVAALNTDTFAVMLSSIDSAADTQTVASKLAMALRHPFSVGGQPVGVSVEVGCAVSPDDGSEPEPLLRTATTRIAASGATPRVAANDP